MVGRSSCLRHLNKRLMIYELTLLTLVSTVLGIVIGAALVPYAQTMFLASGIGFVSGIGLCALALSLPEAVRRAQRWKRK